MSSSPLSQRLQKTGRPLPILLNGENLYNISATGKMVGEYEEKLEKDNKNFSTKRAVNADGFKWHEMKHGNTQNQGLGRVVELIH